MFGLFKRNKVSIEQRLLCAVLAKIDSLEQQQVLIIERLDKLMAKEADLEAAVAGLTAAVTTHATQTAAAVATIQQEFAALQAAQAAAGTPIPDAVVASITQATQAIADSSTALGNAVASTQPAPAPAPSTPPAA